MTTVTKYEGAPPRTSMTDAEAERLRRQVGDDPVKLPDDHRACEVCGVAVLIVTEPVPYDSRGFNPRKIGEGPLPKAEQFGLCDSCSSNRELAGEYLTAHPALASRLGPHVAREHVESVLHGLALLGRAVPADLGLLLPRLRPATYSLGWRDPTRVTKGLCSPYPWAHVTMTQRADLRRAYADSMRDRIALREPPVAVRCPSGGCLLCGVASIDRSALEVSRRGGPAFAAGAIWRQVMTNTTALGRTGPDKISGHVCPACDAAIGEAQAVGQTAIGNAVLAHVQHAISEKKARALRSLLESDFPPTLLGWGALNRPSNAEPWSHLVKVLERL